MKRKNILISIGCILLTVVIAATVFFGIYIYPVIQHMKKTRTIPYDNNLTLILGGGGNTGVLQSDSMILIIDSKMGDAAVHLHDTIMKIARGRKIVVVNSHIHTDHVSGNEWFKGNKIIAGGNYSKDLWIKEAGEKTLPTDWLKDRIDLKVGDETVTILNLAKHIHTVSDVVVYLHNRKILFTGDVVLNKQSPALVDHGADYKGYLAAFDFLQKEFDIHEVVPGHGDIGRTEIIDIYREFFKDMEIAANEPSKESELTAKYKSWTQVPFLMSPGATISFIKKENEK
jgi:glyoxylase-like metal-dependent hydrolase (beta-lactamase superfamily II)